MVIWVVVLYSTNLCEEVTHTVPTLLTSMGRHHHTKMLLSATTQKTTINIERQLPVYNMNFWFNKVRREFSV
jgi:hypothetical protein